METVIYIEDSKKRKKAFTRRQEGLHKTAHHLAGKCNAQVGVIIFSETGELYEYCSSNLSMRQIIDRYQTTHARIGVNDNAEDKSKTLLELFPHQPLWSLKPNQPIVQEAGLEGLDLQLGFSS